jgi:hypothetical protein
MQSWRHSTSTNKNPGLTEPRRSDSALETCASCLLTLRRIQAAPERQRAGGGLVRSPESQLTAAREVRGVRRQQALTRSGLSFARTAAATSSTQRMSVELTAAVGFAVAAAVVCVTTPIATMIAHRTDFYDRPREYRQHAAPTPFLGGAAVRSKRPAPEPRAGRRIQEAGGGGCARRLRSRASSRSSLRPTSRNTRLVASTRPRLISTRASNSPVVPLTSTAPRAPAATSTPAAPTPRSAIA